MKLDAESVEECARMALGGNVNTLMLEEIIRFEQPELRQHLSDFIIMAESEKLSVAQVADRTAAFVYACTRFSQKD
jgi:hypothetical protein